MARGTRKCRPVASDSVVIPMEVAPNRIAAASAAGTAAVRAGSLGWADAPTVTAQQSLSQRGSQIYEGHDM